MGVEETRTQPQVSDLESINSGKVISERAADETLRLVEEYGDRIAPLTEDGEEKLRWKIQIHVLALVFIIDLLLFVSPHTSSD